MKLSTVYEDFVIYHTLQGHSEKTIGSYNGAIKKFINFAGDITLGKLNYELIAQYTLSLYGQQPKLANATIRSYLVHLRAFIHWLSNRGYIRDTKLYSKIIPPKAGKKVVQIYSTEEIKSIFAAIKATPEWIAARNRLIVAFMLDAGMRQSEVATVLKENIDISHKIIKVHGKGDKERYVPMGQLTEQMLDEYIKACPYELKHELFVGKNGEPITNNTIKLFISKLQRKMDIKLSSHKLRHNFATNYIIDQYDEHNTVDIYRLMYLMGHEELSTTQGYLHMAQQYLACRSNISHLDKICI